MNVIVTACAASAAFLFVGCATAPPDVMSERIAAAAVSLGEPIVFRMEAGPDDEPVAIDLLTVADAIRYSILRSPEVQAAMSRVRMAQADAQQARLLPNPVLSVALRFPEAGVGKPIIDAGLSADLLSVLRRPGSIRTADAKLRAASAEAVIVVLDLAVRVQGRFYAIQSLEASLIVLGERRELLQRLLKLAESRLEIGEGTRFDVVTLQTQQVELDSEVADREIELRDERLALARLLGEPTSNAEWTLAAWTPLEENKLSERDCLRLAFEHRPELQRQRWELEALGARRDLVRWDVLGNGDVGIDAERDGDWSLGPAASTAIPLFDVGQASRDGATAAIIEARHQLGATRRQIVEEVRRAHATLTGVRANLDRVQRQLIPLQESRLEQAEAQFRAGQTDITGLLIAEQDLRASKARLIELHGRVAIAQINLERAVGGSGALESLTPTTQAVTTQPAQSALAKRPR